MYFSFIYDQNYMKSDRDFYGDAIISFHPIEYKETYLYLIGQIIGTIDFFKQFTNSCLNQFKLDKLVISYQLINKQFSLIFVTDQGSFNSDMMLKKRASVLYDLIRLIYGPISPLDRTDEENYNRFKISIDELLKNCFNLILKQKRIPLFNSYFSSVDFNLQTRFESKCKLLIDYSAKKFMAFTGVLFYNEKVFYSKIKNHSMMNLLHLLTCEENSLLEKCEPLNENLILPSGCNLVKINVSKRTLESLLNDAGIVSLSSNQSTDDENDELEASATVSGGNDSVELTMDVLPESTRFTTAMALIPHDDSNPHSVPSTDQDVSLNQLVAYVQKNSRLKMVLLSADIANTTFSIAIWQKIVATFSNLEFELIEEERKQETATTNRRSSAMSTSTTASTITTFLADTEPPNSLFSCLIDRTRNVKYSSTSQPNAKSKQAANNAASTTASSSLVANVNLFYELLQSMPELSKLEISKKGQKYNMLRQNVAIVSSSSLCRLPSHDQTSNTITEEAKKRSSYSSQSSTSTSATIVDKSSNQQQPHPEIKVESDQRRQGSKSAPNITEYDEITAALASIEASSNNNSRSSSRMSQNSLKRGNTIPAKTLVEYADSSSRQSLRPGSASISSGLASSSSSPETVASSSSSSRLLLNYLQYGDVFIRCTT